MRSKSLSIAALTCALVVPQSASAQAILNRVEQFLRQQLDSGQTLTPGQPPANQPAYLGLKVDDRQDLGRGVRIAEVSPGSPASTAGLQPGDLVIGIEGKPVRLMADMADALAAKRPADKVAITVNRNGVEHTLEAVLGVKPESRVVTSPPAELPAPATSTQGTVLSLPPPPRPRLGVQTLPVTEEIKRQNNLLAAAGAVVQSVTQGSPAQLAGIEPGAVITAVNRNPIRTPQELAAAIAGAGDQVELTYIELGVPKHQLVSLVQAAPSSDGTTELRARPIDAAEPTPTPAPTLTPPQSNGPNNEELLARIRELESRIEKLEAALEAKDAEAK
jgi:S1-C subfamily serine protease